MTWDLSKMDFIEHLFPIKMKDAKVEEFICHKQSSMSVKDYSLKFVKLYSSGGHLLGSKAYSMQESV